MDQISQLTGFNQAQDEHQLNNENVHPDLQPGHQVSTSPGRYNPYPVHFQRSAIIGEQSTQIPEGSSPIAADDKNGVILDSASGSSRGGGNASAGLGRSSIMLGEDGLPIPDNQKPPQGTEEWSRMRRINHKEVERKRRQTINEGIDELARLISSQSTSAEKNKGAVLQKACKYITDLKVKETAHIEKYTMEKLYAISNSDAKTNWPSLCDQTISELQANNTHLLQQLQLAQQRADLWKATAQGDDSARAQAQALENP